MGANAPTLFMSCPSFLQYKCGLLQYVCPHTFDQLPALLSVDKLIDYIIAYKLRGVPVCVQATYKEGTIMIMLML